MPPPNNREPQSEAIALHEMTFRNLHEGIDCDCREFDGVDQNTTESFARRIRTRRPTLEDFKSASELKLKRDINNTKDLRKYRGVSIDKVGNDEAEIRRKFKELFVFSPMGAGYYCQFMFKPNAGLVWDTRTRKNPHHHTFFKCDAFTLKGSVKVVKIVPLLGNVSN